VIGGELKGIDASRNGRRSAEDVLVYGVVGGFNFDRQLSSF